MIRENEFTICKVCKNRIDVINTKWNLVKCQSCEFVFSRKIFTDEEFIDTYNRLYNYKEDLKYKKHTVVEYNKLKVDMQTKTAH